MLTQLAELLLSPDSVFSARSIEALPPGTIVQIAPDYQETWLRGELGIVKAMYGEGCIVRVGLLPDRQSNTLHTYVRLAWTDYVVVGKVAWDLVE
jgi:hypothetical protein